MPARKGVLSDLDLAQGFDARILWGDPRTDGAARVHEQLAHGVDVRHLFQGGGLGTEVGDEDVAVASVVEPLELDYVCEIEKLFIPL